MRIEIDDKDAFTETRDRRAQIDRSSRLANSALNVRDRKDHITIPDSQDTWQS